MRVSVGKRHSDLHSFNIVIDKFYHYEGHKMRSTILEELAKHFRGYSTDLAKELEFWELIESAQLYGLVEVGAPPPLRRGPRRYETDNWKLHSAIENLRSLVSRTKWLEQVALPQVEAKGVDGMELSGVWDASQAVGERQRHDGAGQSAQVQMLQLPVCVDRYFRGTTKNLPTCDFGLHG